MVVKRNNKRGKSKMIKFDIERIDQKEEDQALARLASILPSSGILENPGIRMVTETEDKTLCILRESIAYINMLQSLNTSVSETNTDLSSTATSDDAFLENTSKAQN